MEIVKDGVILYQSDDKELGKPKPKTPEMALQAAQEYFAEYMSDATAFFDGYRDAVASEHLTKAAFDLHQHVENLYQGLLLVLKLSTHKDPKTQFLRHTADTLDP